MTASVAAEQRHSKRNPCKICGGYDGQDRGQGKRCGGFLSSDGKYAHCTREELAFGLDVENGGTYAHKLNGDCRCGEQHGPPLEDSEPGRVHYDYYDADNRLHMRVVRRFKDGRKTFMQCKPDGAGDWIWKLNGLPKILYKLPELLSSDPAETVFIVEGEKDVDNARKLGLISTTSVGGAGGWAKSAEHARQVLKGRSVLVIADNDDPGKQYAVDVVASLKGIAKSARWVHCPDGHKDLSDWIAAGATAEMVRSLVITEVDDPNVIAGVTLLDGPALAIEDDPLEYLIEQIGLTAGSGAPHMFAGYGFSGKTMAAQEMALAMAAGRPVWGAMRSKLCRVIHVDLEQGQRLTKRRYKRLARAMGVNLKEMGDALVVACRAELRLEEEQRGRWLELMKGRDVLILDSWRAACPTLDENKSEVRVTLDMLGSLSEETGCRAIVIHHARKPNDESKGGRYSIRGSGGFYDGVDCSFVFSAEKGEPVKVACEKAREHGDLCDDFALEIQDVLDGGDPKAGIRVKLYGVERLDEIKQARADKAREADVNAGVPQFVELVARAFAAGVPLSSLDAIRKLLKCKKDLVNQIVHEALLRKLVHRVGNGRACEYRPGATS